MPSGSLNLYRFIEDAWSGGLRAWCEAAAEASAPQSWLLVGNAGQERWLLRKFAGAGIAGVRIFDADRLREELARLAGIGPLALQPAAAFAVKVAAYQVEGDAALTVGRNAGAMAEACDALARAGWHLSQLGIDAPIARRIHKTMEKSALVAGIFDRRLREALPAQAARLCCVGWDPLHWPDLGLLDLAAAKSQSCEVYAPSPRLPADAQYREWIEALEERLGLERATCPESGFHSANEALVARLEKSELASREEARAPGLLVGCEWADQVRLVCGQVLAWLAERPDAVAPIGVIAPEDSPAAVAVAEALEMAGVCVEHPGRKRELAAELLIIEQVARYHLGGHDVEELLELARLLWLHIPAKWKSLEPEKVRDLLDRAFQTAQSRNARILAQAVPGQKEAVCGLVEVLGRWDADFAWPELQEKWAGLLAALGLAKDALPLPAGLFDGERIPAKAFMEWVGEELRRCRAEVAEPDYAMNAPVVVATFDGTAQQSWERIIFLDSNENHWPAALGDNLFLGDRTRVRLNPGRGKSGRLLTSGDLRNMEQARFLDLVEHCREVIVFAGERAQPNEWVMRALLETAGPAAFEPDLWTESAQAAPPELPPALDAAERAHIEQVSASRRNPTMPFDRYQFNFHESKIEPEAWSATDLDMALTRPATFALKELFDAEPACCFFRTEGSAVGNRAHRWLAHILNLGDRFAIPGPAAGDEAKLARELAAARRDLAEWYGAESMSVPAWWDTCLRKTEWAARRCLREVREWLKENYCAAEQSLAVTVRTPTGGLMLKGRIDIVISDRPGIEGGNVRIYDFKTGRSAAPTSTSLGNGRGAQFAAYYLMARDAGAASAVIGIIKPEERARDVFGGADEERLRAQFGVLAELWRNLRFGRRGPLVDGHAQCEALPMATVPIDPAILEQKAGLILLAQ